MQIGPPPSDPVPSCRMDDGDVDTGATLNYDVTEAAQALCRTLRATGASLGHAVGQVCATYGADLVGDFLDDLRDMDLPGDQLVAFLDVVAEASPLAANRALVELLSSGDIQPWEPGDGLAPDGIFLDSRGWIRSLAHGMGGLPLSQGLRIDSSLSLDDCTFLAILPEGMDVRGSLHLAGCVSLDRLPAGLQVQAVLDLDGCVALRSLPHGLKAFRGLSMAGCDAWDRVVPVDAVIEGGGPCFT